MPTISPARTVKRHVARTRPASESPSTRSSGSPAVGVGARRGGKTYSMVRPVISADHARAVGVSARRQVGGDGAAVLEHGDPVADLADLLQPVRDVDDRDALRGQLADDPEQVRHLVVGEHGATARP